MPSWGNKPQILYCSCSSLWYKTNKFIWHFCGGFLFVLNTWLLLHYQKHFGPEKQLNLSRVGWKTNLKKHSSIEHLMISEEALISIILITTHWEKHCDCLLTVECIRWYISDYCEYLLKQIKEMSRYECLAFIKTHYTKKKRIKTSL